MKNLLILGSCLTMAVSANVGCRSTVSSTNTSASASQQLLLNSSADCVIASFDFAPLAGRTCFLNTGGLGTESEGYVPFRIREQMITQGVRLVDSRDEAEVIVEAGLAVYGTDSQQDEIGITDANSVPDVHVYIRGTQYGVVKLSMFAWEKETGQCLWNTPMMRADSHQNVVKFLGTGPFYSGSIQHPSNRIRRH